MQMQPLWIEVWVTIEVPRENNDTVSVTLQKDLQLMALPPLGSHVILDKGDHDYRAEVVKIIMVPYDEADLHHTTALVDAELKTDELFGRDLEEVIETLKKNFGWKDF